MYLIVLIFFENYFNNIRILVNKNCLLFRKSIVENNNDNFGYNETQWR